MTTTQPTNGPAKGNWFAQRIKLKSKFPNLTNADLNYENSRKLQMLGNLSKKLGKTTDEISAIIETI